ncbi:hypothetical protein M4D68_00770 [Priestia aryabhattai]|uniref:hypothetical protein n=1 Tax=Priestia aryabhattai TaxID=412384 RepID=UPI00203C8489|nr:hypothetical protein [Priestia aryabhattai]MCM3639679.1 hypothetical protein [Priestia aryabhattai]
MKHYTLIDIVVGIHSGSIVEGDTFKTDSGHRVIFRNGVLAWVTSGGYIGTAVTVTEENIAESFEKISEEQIVSFPEAMELLAQCKQIRVELDSRDYVLNDLEELDALVEKEYIWELYRNGVYYVVGEQAETEPVKTLGLTINGKGFLELSGDGTVKIQNTKGQLDSKDAYDILHKYHVMNASVKDLAEEYDVSERMIYYVLDGTHWNDAHTEFHKRYQN